MDAILFSGASRKLDIIEPGLVSRKVMAYGEKSMIVEVYFETGAEGAAHSHPHEQISYCLDGSFDYYVGETHYSLKPGDSILVAGGARHGTKCLARGRLLDVFSPPREDFLAR
ncbi:MAG: cupin domain-containing protein [Spirochaetae bacterium HGW-Spirochaetae-9]|nr:MAG: cupin domain-containing protein [Spirochaetae bacterium HGW-Spirochaetae-9]